MKISQILDAKGSEVVTVGPEATVSDVMQDGEIAGIISERDVVSGLAAHGAGVLDMPVSDLMTRSVVTCSPESRVHELMKDMTLGRFRHLPVTKDNKLVGIISIGDVVKNRVEELESETHALRDYVTGSV
jgi:CBS domain-containing protein